MPDFALRRRTMVDGQVRTFDVTDPVVIDAMSGVPREIFVPESSRDLAYSDRPLRLTDGADPAAVRVMLIPMVIARMLQHLDVGPGARVLDVAAGTGYAAALLAFMGARVTALESAPGLAAAATGCLQRAGSAGVEIVQGPLEAGWPAGAPYDRIFVNGAFADTPDRLLAQLGDNGRLVCVLGEGRSARVTLFTKTGEGDIGRRALFEAAAPLLTPSAKASVFVF